MVNRLEQIEAPQKEKMENTRLQRENNYETAYLDTALASLTDNMADSGRANQLFQQYRSLYNQNMLPVMMRNILPPILLALFVLLMLMLMVSTDDSRIFNSAATIVQDIIVPLRKTPFTPEGQVRLIRWMTAGVAILFFFGSIYLSQMDYIRLFTAITTSIWVGGAGSVMTFGLYSRFGTTAGAYASLITGTFISGGGFLVQRGWAATVYPWLVRHDLLPIVEKIMTTLSRPLEPYVVWRMNPIKFPINSTEIFFIAMASSVSMYCLFSLLTYRRPYNLERLLHRGKYNFDGDDKNITSRWTLRTVFSKLIGITPDYTPGDKVIAWSLFLYTFGYKFLLAFVLVVIWNEIMPWNTEMWGKYFFVTQVLIPGPLGAVTTVWFMIGGAFDLRRLFRDLAARKENYLDNGMVAHRVSLADQAAVKAVEALQPPPGENPPPPMRRDVSAAADDKAAR